MIVRIPAAGSILLLLLVWWTQSLHLLLITINKNTNTMMASSQVEISSPFVCRDRCFQNNFNNLVTSPSSRIPNAVNNNNGAIDYTDLWVHSPRIQTTTTSSSQTCNININSTNNNTLRLNIEPRRQRHHHHHHQQQQQQQQQHKDKWARAREMVFSVDHSVTLPDGASSAKVKNMGGVSSLVQKWRGFEAEAMCTSSKGTNAATALQDTTTIITITTTNSNNVVAPPKSPSPATTNEDDVFGDWESDRTTAFSCPASYKNSIRGDDSDATEKERMRVSDIIRKLTEDRLNTHEVGCGGESPPPPRVRTSLSSTTSDHQLMLEQQRCFTPIVVSCSPRIRGRQAYNDLLMKMERDRQKELQGLKDRKAVSKFSHRGRIQALLRFRFLRRGIEAETNQRHFRERAVNDPIRAGSSLKHLIVKTPSMTNNNLLQGKGKKHDQESCHRVGPVEDHIHDAENCITSSSKDVDDVIVDNSSCSNHQINTNNSVIHEKAPLPHISCGDHERSSSLSTPTRQKETRLENNINCSPAGITSATDINSIETPGQLINSIEINILHNKDKDVISQQQVNVETNNKLTDYCGSDEGGEAANNQITYWVSDVSHPEVGWEELQSDYEEQQQEEDEEWSNREWIDEVSRPRSDWEGLRQARYQEMLDPFSPNDDIRTLLARRSVSNFLCSGLREQIDRVMLSRSQGGQQSSKSNQYSNKREKETVGVLVAVPTKDAQLLLGDEYGGGFDNEDEYEEANNSPMGTHLVEEYNNTDQKMSSSLPGSATTSWPPPALEEIHRQVSDDNYSSSDQPTTSPSSSQQSLSSSSPNNTPNSSSYTTHASRPPIEIELIYDLRGHMVQLRQEISELRKSIKCCMSMQTKLQRSINKEVAIITDDDEKINGRRRKKVTISGSRCRVCCKMQIDSVLYKCGHMCICFKCANELMQRGSGKCPICRAPIVDVVRTYS